MPRANFRQWLSRLFPSAAESRSSAFRLRVDGLEDRLAPANFSVTTTANAGVGSLRQAILDANAAPGADVIDFAISGSGIKTIKLNSALPTITETVTIDGTTQTGYADLPLVVLNGANAGNGTNGLVVSGAAANGSIIQGLAIQRFKANGILLLSNNNTVQKCFIGTNATGSAAPGNGQNGIAIQGGSSGNTIGGTTALTGNLISGNGQSGVQLRGFGVAGNLIAGNAIGVDLSTFVSLPNKLDGITIQQGANNNTVGDPNGINLISANGRFGVSISGFGTTDNNVNNNTIAFNASSGIQISAGAANNVVTGFNTISLNKAHGIHITGAGTSGNVVTQNRIGTNFAADDAAGNTRNGIQINGGATNNIIGGANGNADANFISGNGGFGVNITGSGTNGNTVSANFIGLNLAGTAAIANKSSGVQIGAGASGNTIGGTTAGEANVISGNAVHGVLITGAGAASNTVEGNIIGLNATGTTAIANKAHGVVVSGGASNNTIGGATGNIISGNTKNGLNLTGSGTTGNLVTGNTIGLNAAGALVIGNGFNGVQITAAANGNVVDDNVISGNTRSGVFVNGSNQTIITRNNIGTDEAGTGIFANGANGVFVTNKSANNFIGGASGTDGNLIVNNNGNGVLIGANPSAGFPTPAGVGNAILGNSIFNNALLGIDLRGNGSNGLQAAPALTSATVVGSDVQVAFSLTSVRNTTFRIEFFASPVGQGANFLGFIDVTTDANGNATATGTVPYSVAQGTIITATATNLTTNSTSEFSLGVVAV